MMAITMRDPRTFFTRGTAAQFEYVFSFYEEAVRLKANQKSKKPEDFIKLDKWYQVELPKRIKSRGKEAHLTHEELCQCMKWKLARGKFSPRLKDLIQMNTPRLCMTETKKAFRAILKKEDLPSAIQALCNLKGVGPAMASTILTAANPELCAFMADECLMAIPEIESIDYTTKELLNFVEQLKNAAHRLNAEGGISSWNPHRVEQALWAHFVVMELKRDLLDDMPGIDAPAGGVPPAHPLLENGTEKNGASVTPTEESSDSTDSAFANKENVTNGSVDTSGSNGATLTLNGDEDTNDSIAEDTNDSTVVNCSVNEDDSHDTDSTTENTNDSVVENVSDSPVDDLSVSEVWNASTVDDCKDSEDSKEAVTTTSKLTVCAESASITNSLEGSEELEEPAAKKIRLEDQ